MRATSVILWPSFIFAGIGAVVLFGMHDPVDLSVAGPLEFGRKAGYTVGFFVLWAIGAGSSSLTWLLAGPGNARC